MMKPPAPMTGGMNMPPMEAADSMPPATCGLNPAFFIMGEEKHQDVGDDDVDAAVVLGGGGIKECGVGVENHQGQRQDVEDPSLDPVQLLEHPNSSKSAEAALRSRVGRDQSRPFPFQNLSAPGWRGVTIPLIPLRRLMSLKAFFWLRR